jgi:hypothetical protein
LTYPVKAGKLPRYFTAIDTVDSWTLNESKYGPGAIRLPASGDLSVQSGWSAKSALSDAAKNHETNPSTSKSRSSSRFKAKAH